MENAAPLGSVFFVALFAVLSAIAAWRDWSSYRIPNSLTFAIAGLFLPFALTGWLAGSTTPLGVALSLASGALLFALGAALFARGLLGGGDVKFLAAVGLWAGAEHLLPFVLVTAVAGAALGLVYLLPKRQPGHALVGGEIDDPARLKRMIPYGIAIAAGALTVAARLVATPPA